MVQLLDLALKGARTIRQRDVGTMPSVDNTMAGGVEPPSQIGGSVRLELRGHGLKQFSTAQAAGGLGPTLQLPPLAVPKLTAIRFNNAETKAADIAIPAVFLPASGV